mmetsp:Transcript_506/g.796  ORF Transcript_506/g.796 Transcript_506/m.796 type:complete len:98 (+) Transcript_506:506-799(+)
MCNMERARGDGSQRYNTHIVLKNLMLYTACTQDDHSSIFCAHDMYGLSVSHVFGLRTWVSSASSTLTTTLSRKMKDASTALAAAPSTPRLRLPTKAA